LPLPHLATGGIDHWASQPACNGTVVGQAAPFCAAMAACEVIAFILIDVNELARIQAIGLPMALTDQRFDAMPPRRGFAALF